MKLTRLERWMLSNQLRILEALYPDEAKSFAITRTAIECGYTLNYDWSIDNIYRDELSEDACREVFDILEMFSAIERAVDKSTDEEIKKRPFARFIGFDGNNESHQLGYFRYLVEDLDKYARFKGDAPWDNCNSHMPVLEIYRQHAAV